MAKHRTNYRIVDQDNNVVSMQKTLVSARRLKRNLNVLERDRMYIIQERIDGMWKTMESENKVEYLTTQNSDV